MATPVAVVTIAVVNGAGCKIAVPDRVSGGAWHAPENLDEVLGRAGDLVEVSHRPNCQCLDPAKTPSAFLGFITSSAVLNRGMAEQGMSFDAFVLCVIKRALGISFPESEKLKWQEDV